MAKAKLVNGLKTLFQDQKLADVNAAFEKARREAFPEIFTDQLSDLVHSQTKTLKERDCPKTLVKQLAGMKDMVIAKGIKLWTARYSNLSLSELAGQGIYIFIPVIPRSMINLDRLMLMVVYKGRQGYSYLHQSEVSNLIKVPNRPYWMFDVEDGLAMCGKSPQDAEPLIKQQRRTCTIVDEGIAVCTHTPVLSKHFMHFTGSRYRRVDEVPDARLVGGKPELSHNLAVGSNGSWGYASCRSRA